MKRRYLLPIMALAVLIISVGCNDNNIEPVSGYDNKIEFKNIKLPQLYTASEVLFYMDRQYTVVNAGDTTYLNLLDSFRVTDVNGFSYNYYFNHPDSAKILKIQFRDTVWNGTETSLSVGAMNYYKNSVLEISKIPLNMDKISNQGQLDKQYWVSEIIDVPLN